MARSLPDRPAVATSKAAPILPVSGRYHGFTFRGRTVRGIGKGCTFPDCDCGTFCRMETSGREAMVRDVRRLWRRDAEGAR